MTQSPIVARHNVRDLLPIITLLRRELSSSTHRIFDNHGIILLLLRAPYARKDSPVGIHFCVSTQVGMAEACEIDLDNSDSERSSASLSCLKGQIEPKTDA